MASTYIKSGSQLHRKDPPSPQEQLSIDLRNGEETGSKAWQPVPVVPHGTPVFQPPAPKDADKVHLQLPRKTQAQP